MLCPIGRLAAVDMDPMNCHLAGGFADSTVRVWPITQSIYRGRKPYGSFVRRSCAWSLDHGACALRSSDEEDAASYSMTSSDEEDVHAVYIGHRRRKRRQKRKAGRAAAAVKPVEDATETQNL